MVLEGDKGTITSYNRTVLLMEDDSMTRQVTTVMLECMGYAVDSVRKGEEALALYKLRKEDGRPFIAVILDIFQPDGIGGEETIRRLLEYDPAVKAIASSGSTGHETMTDPEKYGFRASLCKPCDFRQLESVLRDVIAEERLRDRRSEVRHGIVTNFTFVIEDKPGHICHGITVDISTRGFRFLTDDACTEGQLITVIKHDLTSITEQKARIMWVRRDPAHYDVGVKLVKD